MAGPGWNYSNGDKPGFGEVTKRRGIDQVGVRWDNEEEYPDEIMYTDKGDDGEIIRAILVDANGKPKKKNKKSKDGDASEISDKQMAAMPKLVRLRDQELVCEAAQLAKQLWVSTVAGPVDTGRRHCFLSRSLLCDPRRRRRFDH